jgi:hypothetical protein
MAESECLGRSEKRHAQRNLACMTASTVVADKTCAPHNTNTMESERACKETDLYLFLFYKLSLHVSYVSNRHFIYCEI